ncbi:Aerobic respiration control sensor protein ArcB [Aliarcobacter thereius]|uniref:histidine kinase n=2 Tax=Aliarcobacter thereius TaxID=544718 RepID=A0A1C0B6J1_9BACT|nr:response regulator [Aliarcobacter thereius]OCL86737.1 Aerobic respiration control sensor protein ArcB [Aliarcobacter thereius]OCL90939.1 Aerobic respiration control sensor protein ArcB [Aliarcobacter thereius]OCL96232.1 Aerobic respiration control sensor protein ArcB [Aliarcobacter thereius LMG 24486]OCL98906.1 Aerobic respiration control sensor protein ArcB [Aliarcobacter thereius]QBF15803.1 two-component system sensor histidine kinase/response regulator fusion protein [Aliarcobacter there
MNKILSKTRNLILILIVLSFFILSFLLFDIYESHKKDKDFFKIIILLLVPILYIYILYIFKRIYDIANFHLKESTKIFNSQKNILLITDGKEINDANRAFLDYFSYKTLEGFKKDYKCICDHFIEEKGYLSAEMGTDSWAKYVYLNPNDNLAKIKRDNKIHIFKVFVQKIEESKDIENTKLVVTLEDISNELAINKELREQKTILQNSNNSKAQFLANISHELRTPLNSVIGFSNLLFDTKLQKEQYNLLKNIDNSSRILINTIDDILNVLKIDQKNIELENNYFSFDELIKNIEDIILKLSINSKNIFTLNKNIDIFYKVKSDKARILQLLTILLSNSYKFTQNGNIELEIRLLNEIDKNIEVLFSVKDTGIGIDKEHINSIFNEFFKVDILNHKDYSGTGLGLAIAQNIANAFNTKIEVESETDKGSVFSFSLSLEKIKEEKKNSYNYPIFEDINILVVDDNKANCELSKKILEKSNVNVTIAYSGEEALEIFKKSKDKFDLIFMDILMPGLNGFDTTLKIREFDSNIPIIALTASTSIIDKELANEIKMDDFLSKPVEPKTLFETIFKYINKVRTNEIDYKSAKTNLINDILNIEVLRAKLSNNDLVIDILRSFIEEINSYFINIIEELIKNDEESRNMLYSLKGMSGNIGANALYNACIRIENKYKRDINPEFEDIKLLKDEIENIKNELKYLDDL